MRRWHTDSFPEVLPPQCRYPANRGMLTAGINLGSAITSFCRWGVESLNFHKSRTGQQRSLGGREHPHQGAGAHCLRVRLQGQLLGPGIAVLLRSPAGTGELRPGSPMMTVKPVRRLDHQVSRRTAQLPPMTTRTAGKSVTSTRAPEARGIKSLGLGPHRSGAPLWPIYRCCPTGEATGTAASGSGPARS